MSSILFVCLANTCRSPALMAALKHFAAEEKLDLHVDSCGVGWVHLGERANPRMFEVAKKRGIFIDHRAQQFQDPFFEVYDYIFAVDAELIEQLKLRNPQQAQKIYLATAFSAKYKGQPIPDPYYLNQDGFEEVMEIIVDSCKGIVKFLEKNQKRV